MSQIASELILLEAGVDYSPTFISTDKRRPSSQSSQLGYYQIGADQQYGSARGPVFRLEFVDVSSLTATHIKIWGIDTAVDSTLVPLYPLANFATAGVPTVLAKLDIYLKKFILCDSNGDEVSEDPDTYTIVGHKLRSMPIGK